MQRPSYLRAAVLAASLTLFTPAIAHAGNVEVAEQLFSDGLKAMKDERWQAACEAFAGSNKADPSPGTQINLGVCNEKQKKYATALTWFDAAARLADDQGREDRAKLARSEYDRVAPKVFKINITIKEPVDTATISRDGEKLPAAVFVNKETPMDPGKHTFELSARGKKPVTKEFSVPETPGKTTIEFPSLENAPVEAGGGGVVGGDTGGGQPYQPPPESGRGQRTFGIILGGAGIVAIIAGVAIQFGLAQSEQSKSDDYTAAANDPKQAPDDKTRQEFLKAASSRHDAAKQDQLIAIIVGGAGVVMLGVGAVLFFTAPSGKTSGKPRVLPVVGPGYAGGSLGLEF